MQEKTTNLENGGGLSKLERLLDGVIHIFMSTFLQRLYRKVQNLIPENHNSKSNQRVNEEEDEQ